MTAARCGGTSMLEVLIALSLLAVSILGAASAQLAALRGADARGKREQAEWIAASMAEALRLPETSSHAHARLRAYAEQTLPGVRIGVVDAAPGVGAVVVHWALSMGEDGRERADSFCALAESGSVARCVTLPFASDR